MFRLDYLSCFLTILATVLVGRKSWTGLLISIANSAIVCVIGFRTSQFGFIPANVICICVYVLSLRSWFKADRTPQISTDPSGSSAISSGVGLTTTWASSPMRSMQGPVKLNHVVRRYYELLPIVRKRKRVNLSKSIAAKAQWEAEIHLVNGTDCHDSAALKRRLPSKFRITLLNSAGPVARHH